MEVLTGVAQENALPFGMLVPHKTTRKVNVRLKADKGSAEE